MADENEVLPAVEGEEQEIPQAEGDVAALMRVLRGAGRQYRPPQYDGRTDVELFIQQFHDVRAANGWDNAAALLHIRSCLVGDAVDCGSGATANEIQTSLRARFGLSERQARDRLSSLQKGQSQSLQALSVETERLVAVAYPGVAVAVRTTLAMDAFTRALNDTGLKRHLLLANAATLTETVRCAEEFLQVSGRADRQRVAGRPLNMAAAVVSTEPKAVSSSAPASSEQVSELTQVIQRLDKLTTLLEQQSRQYQNRGAASHSNTQQWPRKPIQCYGCGENHRVRDCPNSPATSQQSGNGQGPRQ